MTGRTSTWHGGRGGLGSRTGSRSTNTKSNTSKLIGQEMLNDYMYAIGTANQAGEYNKITNYLILHIRKTYENGRDIANAIENQKPFNFNSSAPKLKISTTVVTMDTTSTEKLEIKHENDQYRIEYEAELQLHLKQKSYYHTNMGKHMHSYLGNAQQAYSIK